MNGVLSGRGKGLPMSRMFFTSTNPLQVVLMAYGAISHSLRYPAHLIAGGHQIKTVPASPGVGLSFLKTGRSKSQSTCAIPFVLVINIIIASP